jgi:hypothetical protein
VPPTERAMAPPDALATTSSATDPKVWRRIALRAGEDVAERLHIGGASTKSLSGARCHRLDASTSSTHAKRMETLGFTVVDDARNAHSSSSLKGVEETRNALAKCCVALRDAGLDPTWVFMYDEAWEYLNDARNVFEDDILNGLRCNYDVLAWIVDPIVDAETTAFCPHRDRQPDDAPGSFRSDGTAKYSTIWMPLTDATPENSCLYCIPRPYDPGYFEGDCDDVDVDPMRVALDGKAAYQRIRAMPCRAGGAVAFTHRLIHWGSVGEGKEGAPRINLSCGFADDDYEPPYLAHQPDVPTVEERAGLIAAQLISYHERFRPGARELAVMKKLFGNVKHKFHPSYVKKVNFEFANAALAGAHQHAADGGDDDGADDDDVDDDDDAVEEALDAMLDQADDFEDDFDDFEDGVVDSDEEPDSKRRR